MTKRNLALVLIFLSFTCCFLLPFSSCGTSSTYDQSNYDNSSYSTDPYLHSFFEEMEYDSFSHWYGDSCNNKHPSFYIYKDRALHTFDKENTCTVCGYRGATTGGDGGLSFELLEDGTYAVTGIGSRQNFYSIERFQLSYPEYYLVYTNNRTDKYERFFGIPSYYNGVPVTKIAAGAFESCTEFATLYIPNTIKEIGGNAFWGCESLTEVILAPNSALERIGEAAFARCRTMYSINLGAAKSLTKIEARAFANDECLGHLVLPEGLTTIGEDAFAENTNNIHVHAPSLADWCQIDFANKAANPAVGGSLYFGEENSVLPSEFPKDIKRIGNYAFCGISTEWSELSLPADSILEEIGEYAFAENARLNKLTLPAGVRVAETAFSGCNIDEATVPADAIAALANTNRDSLKKLTVTGGNNINHLSLFPNLVSVSLSAPISHILDGAFEGCSRLKTVELPPTLTRIGKRAFANCTALTSPALPETALQIEEEAFLNCSSFTSLKLPATTAKADDTAFANCPIYSAEVPAEFLALVNLTSLRELNVSSGSFASLPADALTISHGPRWTRLTKVTLADSVVSIGPMLFAGCNQIVDFTMSRMIEEIGEAAFRGCRVRNCKKENGGLYLGVEGNPYLVFLGLENPSTRTTFELHADARYVVGYAFEGATRLSTVTLNEDLIYVGEQAFYGCTALSSLTFAEPTRWYKEPATTPLTYLDLSNASANATSFKTANTPIRHVFG